MIPKIYPKITVELKDGRRIALDQDEDFSRYAPAAVCGIAAKILNLRKILKDYGDAIPGEVRKKLEVIAEPFSFEDLFLSSNIVKVHEGIEELGKTYENSKEALPSLSA